MIFRSLTTLTTALLLSGLAACGSSSTVTSTSEPGAAWPGSRFTPKVEPVSRFIALAPDENRPILDGERAAALQDFTNDYRMKGHGPLVIVMPSERADAEAVIPLLSEIKRVLNEFGFGRDRLLITSRDPAQKSSPTIEIEYTAYKLHTMPCGRSYRDPAQTSRNSRSANFGCALTNSLARMVADPRDLAIPRGTDPADASRRDHMLDTYRKAEPTGTQRGRDESGIVTDVAQR